MHQTANNNMHQAANNTMHHAPITPTIPGEPRAGPWHCGRLCWETPCECFTVYGLLNMFGIQWCLVSGDAWRQVMLGVRWCLASGDAWRQVMLGVRWCLALGDAWHQVMAAACLAPCALVFELVGRYTCLATSGDDKSWPEHRIYSPYMAMTPYTYIHRIWPYIWWFPYQKHRICTVYDVYIYLYIYIYMVLANPSDDWWLHIPLYVQDQEFGLLVSIFVCYGLARTVYIHCIWPYVWWNSCNNTCRTAVDTPCIYLVLANLICVSCGLKFVMQLFIPALTLSLHPSTHTMFLVAFPWQSSCLQSPVLYENCGFLALTTVRF